MTAASLAFFPRAVRSAGVMVSRERLRRPRHLLSPASERQVWFYADGSRCEAGTFASNTLDFLNTEFAAEFAVEGIDKVFLDALEEVVLSPTFVDRLPDATFRIDHIQKGDTRGLEES
jgi:hypothetical protein